MKILLNSFLSILFIFFISCTSGEKELVRDNTNTSDYTQFVNTFIGTGGHGHTFPGVTLPYGMVQLSPDTRLNGWDACAGYHYSDSKIIGFSHTHLSGTGIGDYGDLLFMPITQKAESDGIEEEYRSAFSHDNEVSTPGYYQVLLEDEDINVELTSTLRAGLHRYTYPENQQPALFIDLTHHLHGQRNVELRIEKVNDHTIRGLKRTSGWAKDQYVYFYAEFSASFSMKVFEGDHAFSGEGEFQGTDLRVMLTFETDDQTEIMAKVGISGVDEDGAKRNLQTEIPHWDFEQIRQQAQEEWNKQLAKIDVQTDNDSDKTIFYTALYHSAISPNIYTDIDGRYRAMDHSIRQKENHTNYTVFSLWDTFRAQHPLLTITDPERDNAMINSLIDKYETGGVLPMWELASNYTGTMIGSHAIPVIVDAYNKGIRDYDIDKAYEAVVHAALYDTTQVTDKVDRGILNHKLMPPSKQFKNTLGYIPSDKENQAVAKGLEYAYNDWCVAQFAKALGKEEDYEKFSKLALNYQNYFDSETGFMRGKLANGNWKTPFNPKYSNHQNDDYCEGNGWQWLWFVPHDVPGLASLMGGEQQMITKLDTLFSTDSNLEGEDVSADISGLIGQYAHGNEPSHHTTHMYNQVGQPWKTQQLVDQILTTLYFNDPNGLPGNEDCGQMSAWYILNAMGFYSFCPGSAQYSIGRPLFDEVTIDLSNGKQFTISTENNSRENKYIQSATLNGEPLSLPVFSHQDILNGGELSFVMGDQPNKHWGAFITTAVLSEHP
uniref:GH92 family glycosyl hydrolase n=1 Tax=Roseihalotalea indica TaxID=2867963 RepID=A0AA49GIP5_9BACT|nr:GH92 family glycosyl hydrolase [Tunicatimonas sp. TK19036]